MENSIGGWNPLLGAITQIGSYIIITVLELLKLVTELLSGVASAILNAVLSPNFISWSYTGADNPVVTEGLKITQSFVNMALILILVVIAFSTILRVSGYRTKDLLIQLIITALLVNFIPVITGVIVDASNIIMYYFIGGDGISAGNLLVRSTSEWGKNLALITGEGVIEQFSVIAELSILILSNLTLIFIFFIFTIIFVARYVAIWVLVILAPLAFVSRILPSTKKIWGNWWNQFIQWCFIGATAAFFLYLSDHVANSITTAQLIKADTNEMTGVFDYIFPHFVTIAFMVIGLLSAFKSVSLGSKQVARFSKWAGKAAVRRTWEKGSEIDQKTKEYLQKHPKLEKAARKFGTATRIAAFPPSAVEEIPKVGGYARRFRQKAQSVVGKETIGRTKSYFGVKEPKELIKRYNEAKKNFEERKKEDLLKDFSVLNQEEKAAAYSLFSEKDRQSFLTNKQRIEGAKALQRIGGKEVGAVLARDPHMLLDPEIQKVFGRTINQVVENSKPKDITDNISEEALKSQEVIMQLLQDAAIVKAFGQANKNKRKTIVQTLSTMWDPQMFSNLSSFQNKNLTKQIIKITSDPLWKVDESSVFTPPKYEKNQ